MTFCVALAFVIAFARTSSRESQIETAARHEGEEADSGATGDSLAAWVSANIAERHGRAVLASFAEAGLSADTVQYMSEKDIDDLGLALAPRLELRRAVAAFAASGPEEFLPPSLAEVGAAYWVHRAACAVR